MAASDVQLRTGAASPTNVKLYAAGPDAPPPGGSTVYRILLVGVGG